ncbi:MAG: NBR1-Ig-like domain-containing protein, partial [Chloroflexota bacterium]
FTQLAPGAAIDKRWAVKNTGSCDWGRDYQLVFIEGNSMGAASEHALYPAKAGTEAVMQINMIAPDAPGDYSSRWQMRDPSGNAFGPVLFIKITVLAIATALP